MYFQRLVMALLALGAFAAAAPVQEPEPVIDHVENEAADVIERML